MNNYVCAGGARRGTAQPLTFNLGTAANTSDAVGTDGQDGGVAKIVFDQWIEIRVEVNLEANYRATYNGVLLGFGRWYDPAAGRRQVGGGH